MFQKMSGPAATLRWGYRLIATLHEFEFTASGQGGTFTAQITACDEFGLEQRPLVVVVPAGASEWKLPVRSLQRDGSNVTMTIGPVE